MPDPGLQIDTDYNTLNDIKTMDKDYIIQFNACAAAWHLLMVFFDEKLRLIESVFISTINTD